MKIIRDHHPKIFAFVDQAVFSGGSFILNILLARWAGLEAFGAFTMMFMVVLLINNFNQSIITQPLITLLTKQNDKEGYIQGVKVLQLLMLLPYGVVILIIILVVDKTLPEVSGYSGFYGFLALGITYQLHEFARKIYFSYRHLNKALILDTLVFGAQFILIAFYHLQGELDQSTILFSLALSYSLSIPAVLWRFRLGKSIKSLRKVLKLHWRFSGWLMATSFVQWLAGNYVFITAGTILGVAAVGILKVGQSLSGAILALYQVFENYVPPGAASIIQTKGENTMWKYLFSILAKGGVIVILLAGIVVIFPEALITIFYGDKYLDETIIVQMFVLLSVITFPGFLFRIGIRTVEDNKHIFLAYVFNICFCFLTAVYFIEQYKVTGAVWVLIFSQVAMLSWYIIYYLWSSQERISGVILLTINKRFNR